MWDSYILNRLFLYISQNNGNAPPTKCLKKVYQVIVDNNSGFSKPFTLGLVAKVMMITKSLLLKIEKTYGMWYLDSCASQYLCNNKSLFKDL